MDQKILIIGVAVLALLVVLVALQGFTGGPAVPGAGAGVPTVTIPMYGQIYLKPTPGEDLPCVGAPPGYTRIYFEKSEDGMTVVYYKQGNDLQGAYSWLTSALEGCGYKKEHETEGSFQGITGKTFNYSKGSEEISAGVFTVKGDNGVDYTFIGITKTVYTEEENYESGYVEENAGSTEGTESPTPVKPTGSAAEWDSEIRPLLESVFGEGITLTGATTTTAVVMLEYTLPRAITSEDTGKVTEVFTLEGWLQIGVETSGSHVTHGFTKDNTFLTVEYDTGGNTVSVVAGVTS